MFTYYWYYVTVLCRLQTKYMQILKELNSTHILFQASSAQWSAVLTLKPLNSLRLEVRTIYFP